MYNRKRGKRTGLLCVLCLSVFIFCIVVSAGIGKNFLEKEKNISTEGRELQKAEGRSESELTKQEATSENQDRTGSDSLPAKETADAKESPEIPEETKSSTFLLHQEKIIVIDAGHQKTAN